MIKSIYIDSQNIAGLEKSGANNLMVTSRTITSKSWKHLQELGFNNLSIAVDAFDKGVCPLDPQALRKLSPHIGELLKFKPDEIWLDHFRFGGDCTDIEGKDVVKAHQECRFCKGADRIEAISNLARRLKGQIGDRAKLGIYAVAFRSDQEKRLSAALGLDYGTLGQVFDMSSPMLYHRMIKRPVSYISKYTKWMSEVTGKPVLPIIQIKDMPDDLPDDMAEDEIRAAFNEAKKVPSEGVAIFWWQHALEKHKEGIVSTLFSQ